MVRIRIPPKTLRFFWCPLLKSLFSSLRFKTSTTPAFTGNSCLKYSIKHDGADSVMIRVSVSSKQLPAFIQFIENQRSFEQNQTLSVNNRKSISNEDYFIRLHKAASDFYFAAISSGLPVNAAISETLLKLKGATFFNISYDSLKSILSRQGCFRAKSSLSAVK
jgi:hypothetical protein